MCGRYDNLIARDAYRGLFKAKRLPKSNFPLRYNIAPTDQIPIVRIDPRDGEREVVMARWGLIPFWMKEKPKVPHINARAETVDRLPLFREAFAKRRCLIPATGFYEWQQREDGKQPYRFRRKDLEPFAFAGIWEFARLGGEEILSTAIIVGQANPLVGGIHDRMPVMLMLEDYDLFSLMGLQGVIELVGGFLILIGLFTRPVAFILAGNMAVAYFMAHAPRGFFPTLNGGQLAILFCFVFLYLAVAGGGQWSVDTQIARRRSIA